MKIAKRSLTYLSLICVAIMVAILIAGVFGVSVFKGIWLYTLLSLATIAVASGFAINSLNIMKKKKVVAIISLLLIAVSVVLAFIIYWSAFSVSALFGKITIMVAVTTIFFIIIVSTNTKVGNYYKALQAITFTIIVFIDVVIVLSLWNISPFKIPFFTEIFIVACLVIFGLLCTLSILGKRVAEDLTNEKIVKKTEEGFVRIPVEEYVSMQSEIANLKKELESLKNASTTKTTKNKTDK